MDSIFNTSKLTAIVVDDEDNSRNLLLRILKEYIPEIEVIASTNSPVEGYQLAEMKRPQVLFLDVEMPGKTGINLAEGLTYDPYIVFVTAHDHYAIKAIKAGAFDYLLKPVDIDELQKSVSKIIEDCNKEETIFFQNKSENKGSILALPVKEGILYIKQEEIMWVEADGSYTTIYLQNGERQMLSKNLKELGELLNTDQFFRSHASFIVNLGFVSKLIKTEGLFIQLQNGKSIPVSRKYKDNFLVEMNKFRTRM